MSIIDNWRHSWHKWVIKSEDGLTKNTRYGRGEIERDARARWLTAVRYKVPRLNPRGPNQGTSNILVVLGAI